MSRNGRPPKLQPLLPPLGAQAKEIDHHITIFLDNVMSWLYSYPAMPLATDVVEQMKQRLLHECEQIQKARKEMAKLATAYNRYVDLKTAQERSMRRVQRIMAVLGPAESGDAMKADESDVIGETVEPVTTLSRHDLPVWEAMKEYLLHVREARIAEIERFLYDAMALSNVNRQAIESALKHHPETFRTRRKKREKYILLKDGAVD